MTSTQFGLTLCAASLAALGLVLAQEPMARAFFALVFLGVLTLGRWPTR